MNKLILLLPFVFLLSCADHKNNSTEPKEVSGIYPHLAMYNSQGECGTGAIVPWADRLWVITYAPHMPFGSDDKLYEITTDLKQVIREESLGGTPANRMIHEESNQLFIGPYAIDSERNVRAIPYTRMQGRHTGNARHLSHPESMIYFGTMEEGFYEVDVHTLKPTMLYPDLNKPNNETATQTNNINVELADLPGAHGKGLYSGQGVLVYSNNGEATPEAKIKFDIEAGALAEWDGTTWKVARRNQFVEVTGPGGIYGNTNPEKDPIWATGWDHKSIILGVRNPETGWDFYRLPKASHSYDGAHGWNTEWPRIRDIGTKEQPDYLMTMHGMFWKFPGTFTAENAAGIRPRSAYLKVIGDFARWKGKLIFGCDDSAKREFLNKRKHKGGISGPGQSNSNLWFTDLDKPDMLGPTTASGSVWQNEEINAGAVSEPMLFSGWPYRSIWIQNAGEKDVSYTLEVDKSGNNSWEILKVLVIRAGKSAYAQFSDDETGEWVRVRVNSPATTTVTFNYSGSDERETMNEQLFSGLAHVEADEAIGGLLYGLGNNRRSLGIAASLFENDGKKDLGYYELNEKLNLVKKEDEKIQSFIKSKFAIPEHVIEVQESSVLIIDDEDRRWRLPLGNKNFKNLTDQSQLRICREVATERDLLNSCGTFYELPAENADGFAKIRPISSHNFRIHDYASYRGMLVMTGIDPGAKAGKHIIKSDDGKAAVWAGVIDDLWEMGKPIGHGGPWLNSRVKAGVPSDPYLISHFDKKTVEISHQSQTSLNIKIEIEPIGHGPWMLFKEITVQPGETFKYSFDEGFQARWIRFIADKNCIATAWLEYN